MCYSACMGQAAAQAAQQAPQVDTFDDADAFAWLDALEDDALDVPAMANASADESAESSQIKMEGEPGLLPRGPAGARGRPTGLPGWPARSDAERLFGRPARRAPPRRPQSARLNAPAPPPARNARPAASATASGSVAPAPLAAAPAAPVGWAMPPPPMAMPGFPPMYAAPWMMAPPPAMVAPMAPPAAPQPRLAPPAAPAGAAAPAPAALAPPAPVRKANPVANPGAAATLAATKHRKVRTWQRWPRRARGGRVPPRPRVWARGPRPAAAAPPPPPALQAAGRHP
jgi:hypothetical protein